MTRDRWVVIRAHYGTNRACSFRIAGFSSDSFVRHGLPLWDLANDVAHFVGERLFHMPSVAFFRLTARSVLCVCMERNSLPIVPGTDNSHNRRRRPVTRHCEALFYFLERSFLAGPRDRGPSTAFLPCRP